LQNLKDCLGNFGESRGQFTAVLHRSIALGAEVLRDQDTRTRDNASEMLDNLHLTKQLGHESRDALLAGDLRKLPN